MFKNYIEEICPKRLIKYTAMNTQRIIYNIIITPQTMNKRNPCLSGGAPVGHLLSKQPVDCRESL